MDVEMTTQAEMTFKCTPRSSKVAPIESQCMISYQLSIVTFAVSHSIFEKFDVKQSNDLEICPRSLTVVSPQSCRVAMYVKCSEDSERMKRKSPLSTTPCEYLHNTARNYVPWATFLSLTVYGQLCKFSNSFVRYPETPTHQLPSPKQILTQNGHSRSFKVTYFGIIKKPLMGYIAQYNKCCLRCEDSEDISSERSENLHFRPPHSHSPANPREYLDKTYLAKNQDPWATFLPLILWSIFMQILVVGSETHVCNATECIIAVEGHFRINQGR